MGFGGASNVDRTVHTPPCEGCALRPGCTVEQAGCRAFRTFEHRPTRWKLVDRGVELRALPAEDRAPVFFATALSKQRMWQSQHKRRAAEAGRR
jgi:hypothetical protein